jgi:hypothetical protein
MKNYSNENINFPTCNVWGEFYSKFRKLLLTKLSSYYCFADREDAVEYAFDKLMNKKDKEAYGDKMPKTEEGWFGALYWQSKSYLSHMREHGVVHAKYVEAMAKELENVFDPGYAGEFLDDEVYSKALSSALNSFRKDQDISCRDLKIVFRQYFQLSVCKLMCETGNFFPVLNGGSTAISNDKSALSVTFVKKQPGCLPADLPGVVGVCGGTGNVVQGNQRNRKFFPDQVFGCFRHGVGHQHAVTVVDQFPDQFFHDGY